MRKVFCDMCGKEIMGIDSINSFVTTRCIELDIKIKKGFFEGRPVEDVFFPELCPTCTRSIYDNIMEKSGRY